MVLSEFELTELKEAKALIEKDTWDAKIAKKISNPIERAFEQLPDGIKKISSSAAQITLEQTLKLSIATLKTETITPQSSDFIHQLAAVSTGMIGGGLGKMASWAELPLSTAIILRSIADIARSKGEDLLDPGTRLACIEVFSMGPQTEKKYNEAKYYATRLAISKMIHEAIAQLAFWEPFSQNKKISSRIIAVATRLMGIKFSKKMSKVLTPALGAFCGGVLNIIFIKHFQNLARGHFIIRQLEKKYGFSVVKTAYEELSH